jgi:hypothetical protein
VSSQPKELVAMTIEDVNDALDIDIAKPNPLVEGARIPNVPEMLSDVELFVDSDRDSTDGEFDKFEAKGVTPQSEPAHINPQVLVQAKKGDQRVREVEVSETHKNGVIASRKVIYRFFEIDFY